MDSPEQPPAPAVREALERLLLAGPRRWTRLQVAERAGMPPERTQRLWRALGFPDVADDYLSRSWDRNVRMLADALAALGRRGLLLVDDPATAAEQFTWLVLGAPLNRLTLNPALPPGEDQMRQGHAEQAVETVLCRYGPRTT